MSIDISFLTKEGKFNYRTAMIMLNKERLLVMKDKNSPYYYIPGGRVNMQEDAQTAICREMMEELKLDIQIIRPLWMAQSFFEESVSKQQFHELSLFFLAKPNDADFLNKTDSFEMLDSDGSLHEYHWIPLHTLHEIVLYPRFISEKIHNLSEHMELVIEHSSCKRS